MCGRENTSRARRSTTEEFIEEARKIHGGKYDYSKVKYTGAFNNVEIICPKHGSFYQTPTNHLRGKDAHTAKIVSVKMKYQNF